jgi:hypothetical protein
MTSGNAVVETITSDPVIVEVSDAQKSTANVDAETGVVEETPQKDEAIEDEMQRLEIGEDRRRPSYRQPTRKIRVNYSRSRSRSRSPYRHPMTECTVLANTASLNTILEETDSCVETIKGQLVYTTTHPFHSADLQKLSWLFQIGIPECWIQKPTTFFPGSGVQFSLPRGGHGRGRNEFYDDGYDVRYDNGRGPVALARLGSALCIFKDDTDPMTSKVKFVTAVQVKNDSSWIKLVVSHSRQAAAADICHELLNNHSIIFVGAVLRNIAVPADNPNMPLKKLQRVASVKEAEEVDQGVIGVIC